MSENLDLSKVVSLIMENPALIEEISSLAKKESTDKSRESAEKEEQIEAVKPTYGAEGDAQNKRAALLAAFKPYLSENRRQAIDTMISLSGVIDMMKGR